MNKLKEGIKEYYLSNKHDTDRFKWASYEEIIKTLEGMFKATPAPGIILCDFKDEEWVWPIHIEIDGYDAHTTFIYQEKIYRLYIGGDKLLSLSFIQGPKSISHNIKYIDGKTCHELYLIAHANSSYRFSFTNYEDFAEFFRGCGEIVGIENVHLLV